MKFSIQESLKKSKIMTKKLLTILTIVAVVFASCSKTKKLTKQMTGKWTISSKDYKYTYNNVVLPSQTYNVAAKGSVELKSDGTGTFNDPSNANGDIAVYSITDWYNDDAHISLLVKDQSGLVNQWTFDIAADHSSEKQVWTNESNPYTNSGVAKTNATYTLAITK